MEVYKSLFSAFIKIFFFIQIFLLSICAQDTSRTNKENKYGLAFIKSILQNVDINDAFVAIKVWVNELNKHEKLNVKMYPVFYNNMDDLIQNINKDKISNLVCTSIDYLKYKSKLQMTPVLVDPGEDGNEVQFLLLTRKKDNIKNIAELEGQKIIIQKEANSEIINMWLEVTLHENKLKFKDKFFQKIKTGGLASHTILSVFFGQNDACVVTKTAFETMTELNPQMGRDLNILLASPNFIEGLSCYSNYFMKMKIKDDMVSSLTGIDKYPAGRQIYTLLRVKKLLPFKEELLNSAKVLLKRYNALNITH